MDIIVGTSVDLITPFPESEIHRIWDWMAAFQSVVQHDYFLSREEYEEYFKQINQEGLTYGIIDKNNMTGSTKVEYPIVGMIMFEPASPNNFYGHIATSRKCGKSYKLYNKSMPDESVQLACDYVFNKYNNVQRISALVMESNAPVRGLLHRVGFNQEAILPNWFIQKSNTKSAVHYGKYRGDVWDKL